MSRIRPKKFSAIWSARLLAIATLLPLTLAASPHAAFPSCWASNPEGTRSCARYVNRSGGLEYLCEDQPGDCENLGYTKAPEMSGNAHRASPEQPHSSSEARVPKPRHSARHTRPVREDSGVSSQAIETSGNETEVAAGLIAILVLTGISILPPRHRSVLFRIAQGMAVVAGVALLFFLVLLSLGSSDSRRRRYY